MRFAISVVAVLAVVGAIACGGGGVHGTYVREQVPGDYLELKSDGTFFLMEGGLGAAGEWDRDGDSITLTIESGRATRVSIDDGRIIDNDGEVWVRQ